MKHLIFTFFCFIISCQSKSQDKIDLSRKNISHFEKDAETGWIRVNLNNPNKWGFINRDSVVVIPFEYDFLNPFDENKLAYVKNKGKEFYINSEGKVVIKPIYQKIGLFSEGLVAAQKDNKTGYLDINGNLIIPFIYDSFNSFYQGLTIVCQNKKCGCIDNTGKKVIPLIYDHAEQSHVDKILLVEKGKKWAFINSEGKLLSDFIYDKVFSGYNLNIKPPSNLSAVSTFFKNGAVLVRRDNIYEFLNEKIDPAFVKNKFDSASVFDTYQNAIVKSNGKYGIIKSNGDAKVPIEFDYIEYFDSNHLSSEYYNARKGKVFSIYNKDLKKIGESYEPVYNDFSVNNPTLIFKDLKNKYGMVDWQGKVLVQFKYDRMDEIEGTPFLRVANGERFGIIDKKGTVKIPIKYKEIYSLYDKFDDEELQNKNLFIADQKIIDISNTIILDGYKVLQPVFYNHSKLIVSKNKKFGIVDVNNNVLLPIQYDEISNWVEYGPRNRHIIKKGNLYGMLDYETFEEKIPVAYDFVFITYNMAFAKKNNKYGIIDLDNKILCPFIYDDLKPAFAYGFGRDNDKVYAKKGKQFYEINLEGKILHTVSRKEFLEKTSMPDLPPPPQK